MKQKSLQYSVFCPQEVREGLKLHFLPAPVKVPFQMILEQKGVIGKVKERPGKEEYCKKELM